MCFNEIQEFEIQELSNWEFQMNWKHLYNEIVNNMYLDIENNYKHGIATLAEHVFYRNWSSIDNDSDDFNFGQPNYILNEIKIGDIVQLTNQVGKTFSIIVNEILQNEYIGTINRVTFDLEFEFGDTVSFTR